MVNQINSSNAENTASATTVINRTIGRFLRELCAEISRYDAMEKIIAKDPIMIVKIKARSFSTFRISYSTLFAIFSCSVITMLEGSSFFINFAFQLFEQNNRF